MEETEITLRLPRALHDAASHLSARRGTTLGHLLQEALSRTMREAAGDTAAPALTAALRDRLIPDFDQARSWPELQGRLLLKGSRLRQSVEGLALYHHPGDQRICTLSALGQCPEALSRRFGRAFPAHARSWIPRAAPPAEKDALRPTG